MTDQWELQSAAEDALAGFTDLWHLKMGATHAPQKERTTKPSPGPSSPNGDNDLTLDLEGILLGSIVQDKNPDLPVGLHRLTAHAMTVTSAHGMAVAKSGITCCKLIRIYSYDIADKFDRADELHDLLSRQAQYLDRFIDRQEERIHGADRKTDDVFLTDHSLQQALIMRGIEIPSGTIRYWAGEGKIAISRSAAGKRTYSLRDVIHQFDKRKETHADHHDHNAGSQELPA